MSKHTMRWSAANRSERGGALVMALMAVMAVGAMSMTFFQLSSSVTRSQRQTVDRKKAFYLAEAGLAESFAALAAGKTGQVGSESAPAKFGEGLFWVDAEAQQGGEVNLVSTAMAGSGRVALGMVVGQQTVNVGSLGLFSDRELVLPPGSVVAGFDSKSEPLAASSSRSRNSEDAPEVLASIGSNAGVIVQGAGGERTEILGDVRPGPGHTVTLGTSAEITGSTDPALATVELVSLPLPEIQMQAGFVWNKPLPFVCPPGTYAFESLRAASLTDLALEGPTTLIVGDLTLDPGARMTLDARAGPIEIHVTGSIDLKHDSELVCTERDPSRVLLHLSGEQAEGGVALGRLRGKSEFHGRIYAPHADVQVHPDFELHGSLAARQIETTGAVSLHIDRGLVSEGGLTRPSGLSWRILELPEAVATLTSTNPFKVLGVDPDLLPSPHESHADNPLDVTYVDKEGRTREYEGPERDFDWDKVAHWKHLTRERNGERCDLGTPSPAPQRPASFVSHVSDRPAADRRGRRERRQGPDDEPTARPRSRHRPDTSEERSSWWRRFFGRRGR